MNYPRRLLQSFEELSGLVVSKETVPSTLEFISELAVRTIPACDIASVSLVKAEEISTVGSSDDIAATLDAIQYETGQGPCLDAIGKDAGWFQIDEMSHDTKWPQFSARAARHGFESLLAFTLRVDAGTLGALNLYARQQGAFGEEDRDYGAIYAAHAATVLARAQGRSDATEPREAPALSSEEIVGRAVGILMEGESRTAKEALVVLEERAEQLKMRLRDSAEEIVRAADRRREAMQLPEGFTERLVGRARGEETHTRSRPSPPLMAIAGLVAGGALGVALMNGPLGDARRVADARRDALQAVLANSETALELRGTDGEAAAIVASGSGTLFVAEALPPAPSERVYQLWLLQDGEIVARPIFETDQGLAVVHISQAPGSFDQVMVTLEPAGGSDEPTTDPVLASR